MTFGTKTNERPGTRAQVRHLRVSAYKAREVLDLIRGLHVDDADGVLEFTERAVATEIRKVLGAAVANAEHNDEIDPNELYVSACFADEGPTMKRWRPRARGRATRIRKRTCHITIIVSRMDPKQLEQRRARTEAAVGRGGVRRDAAEARRARVAKSQAARAAREAEHDHDHDHEDHDHEHEDHDHEDAADEVVTDEVVTDQVVEDLETIETDTPAAEEAAASEPEASDAMGGYAKGGEAPLDAQTDEGSQEPEEKS
jgi:large subunit ribosomal protein L22